MQQIETHSSRNSQAEATDLSTTVATLVERSRRRLNSPQRIAILGELVELYDRLSSDHKKLAADVRQAFLRNLEDTPEIIKEERFSGFLAERIEAEDFEELEWQRPQEVIAFYELLNRFQFHNQAMADHVHTLQENLLRYALQRYEDQGDFEKMFALLSLAPITDTLTDDELQRLKHRAYLYEMQRVRRYTRGLTAYLALQVILTVVVFPLLFVYAEAGRSLTYWDGLYWAIITAASIGYGDLTPQTVAGKAMAAMLGVMGVVTVGVIAGLILNRIAPRSID